MTRELIGTGRCITVLHAGEFLENSALPGHKRPVVTAALLTVALAGAPGAYAQTVDDSFDVTVLPSASQSEIVTQGPATLDGASLSLRALDRMLSYIRLRGNQIRSKGESTASLEPKKLALLASLGSVVYADLSADEEGEDAKEVGAGFSRLGSFTDISYEFGSHDTTRNTPGHDTGTLSITAGLDYRFSSTLVLGGGFNYVNTGHDFDGNIGKLDSQSFKLAALGSWYVLENGYVDGIIQYGFNDYDNRRRDALGGTATGNTDGQELSINVGSGYDFNYGGWTGGPRARVTYIDVSIDGYSERNSSQALTYSDQDVESLNTNLGVEASYAIRTDFGVVLPQANVEWIHEFEDETRSVIAQPASGGARFRVPVDALDDDYFRGSIGATAILAHGRMVFVRYEGQLGRADRDLHAFSLGARLEF